MLTLIGLGLATKDLSLRAIDEIKNADKLLLETYTAFIPNDYVGFIEKQAGKKPVLIKRKALEDDLKRTVATAKSRNIIILVPGDPLIATTHSIILNEAKKQGIKCEVIHAPSVFSIAIGESGLDVYKFGPTVTIPFWSERYRPTSFIDAIQKNFLNGQHTLVLLDIDQKSSRPMKILEALDIIKKAQASRPPAEALRKKIMIMANLGREDKLIRYVAIEDVDAKLEKELEGKQLSLIIPSSPSFSEEESLARAAS